MRIYRSNEFRTLLLPLLLALALLASIAVTACSSGTAEDSETGAPAAGEHADGVGHDDVSDDHADDADHGDLDETAGEETHDDDGHGPDDGHEDEVSTGHDDPEEIVVMMTDQLTFGPEEIVVPAGEPVRLVINNQGQALHDFTVDQIPVTHMHHDGGSVDEDHMSGEGHDEFDLHVALDGGDAGVLEFVPGEPGEYVFHCTVPGHTDGGMHGELIVRATD